MTTLRYMLILLILLGLLAGCSDNNNDGRPVEIIPGSGKLVTEERPLDGFTAVSLQGVGRLEIDQTGSESVSITADDNFLPYIETRVQGSKLIINIQENIAFSEVTDLVYNVTVKKLDDLQVDGAGNVQVSNLAGNHWRVNLNGTGNVDVSGEIARQDVEINGLGRYNAEDLSCQEATIEQNGAGLAVLSVSDRLDVTIAGIGSVEYIGNPTVKQTLNGAGRVKQR